MSLNLASTLKSDRHLQSYFSIGEERWQSEQTTIPNASISLPNLQIDPEFSNLIPPLSQEEKSQLEANLKKFGCIDSLVVWQGTRILLDGHNRYSICTQLQIPYKIVEIEIPDREAAICWIANHQLGRRNITPETISYLRGKRYLHLKGNREDNLKQNLPNGKSFLSVEEEEEHLPNGKNFLSVEEEVGQLPNGKNFLSVEEEEEHLPNGKSF
ncbi:MAG: hypothetical protein PUP91_34560, partial [Rhizonema sp. PD37]|nr:hypothetical protein [Rhizonema sp. PD37]